MPCAAEDKNIKSIMFLNVISRWKITMVQVQGDALHYLADIKAVIKFFTSSVQLSLNCIFLDFSCQ